MHSKKVEGTLRLSFYCHKTIFVSLLSNLTVKATFVACVVSAITP